jgi:hypothetical protein
VVDELIVRIEVGEVVEDDERVKHCDARDQQSFGSSGDHWASASTGIKVLGQASACVHSILEFVLSQVSKSRPWGTQKWYNSKRLETG